jgi:hypothetical protein
MSVYRWIGILRCPYRDECGPDKMIDYGELAETAEEFCFTRRHLKCGKYKSRKQEATVKFPAHL